MSVTTQQVMVCDTCGKSKMTVDGSRWTKNGLYDVSREQGWKWLDNATRHVCPKCYAKSQKAEAPAPAKKPAKAKGKSKTIKSSSGKTVAAG